MPQPVSTNRLTVNATASSTGAATFSFPQTPQGYVFVGAVGVPSAPALAVHNVTVNSVNLPPFYAGNMFGPVEALGLEILTITSSGLTPNTQYQAIFIGQQLPQDQAGAFPIPYSSNTVAAQGITGGVPLQMGVGQPVFIGSFTYTVGTAGVSTSINLAVPTEAYGALLLQNFPNQHAAEVPDIMVTAGIVSLVNAGFGPPNFGVEPTGQYLYLGDATNSHGVITDAGTPPGSGILPIAAASNIGQPGSGQTAVTGVGLIVTTMTANGSGAGTRISVWGLPAPMAPSIPTERFDGRPLPVGRLAATSSVTATGTTAVVAAPPAGLRVMLASGWFDPGIAGAAVTPVQAQCTVNGVTLRLALQWLASGGGGTGGPIALPPNGLLCDAATAVSVAIGGATNLSSGATLDVAYDLMA